MAEENLKSTASNSPLKVAVIKRNSIKGQITKFKNYLKKISDIQNPSNIQLTELNLKLTKFEAISLKFDDLQTEIEILNCENFETEVEIRESIEQELIISIATAKSFLEHHNNLLNETRRQSTCTTQCFHNPNEPNIKLPQIQIAKFDGSYFRWLEFRDTFKNLVHDNSQLSPIQKFYYLNSYLESEAARVISNLEISSDNYEEAWSLLNERYDNKRLLIDHHLNSLCNIQAMTRESERSLRYLVDHVTKNLRALSTLGLPTDKWDVLLIFILAKKLDPRTLVKWEELRNAHDSIPSLDMFNKFLTDRANVLEALNRNKFSSSSNNMNPREHPSARPNSHPTTTNKINYSTTFASATQEPSTLTCIICNEGHRIYDCAVFKAKNINDRMLDVKKHNLCTNCLRRGHSSSHCRMGPCRECKKRHNTLLHEPRVTPPENNTTHEAIVSFSNQNTTQVLLSTAQIKVTNPHTNKSEIVRALLDCGSQSSFISQTLKEKLSLPTNPVNTINIVGIGNNSANQVKESCIAQLGSTDNSFQVKLSCLVLGELTGELPRAPINVQDIKIPKDIRLADPTFYQPAPIDVLIGADLFWDIVRGERRSLGTKCPNLLNSQFGWLIAGPIHTNSEQKSTNKGIHCNHAIISNSSDESVINEYLPKFWELEELPNKRILSENDKACEKQFIANTVRLSTGRFCVKLPLISSPDCLGDTYNMAKKRLLSLEKRFGKNPNLKTQYVQFLREYADLDHVSVSPISKPQPSYFLCHHAVFKNDSESTKLRVVFDGSNPTSSGYSLNDILMVGPNVQDSLFNILIRARQYKYVLSGDIEKMYRQVLVADTDRNLQLILWREDESQPIKTLRLNTVTYGTASASYLSTRCLWQVGEECADDSIKTIIQKDFYVDDLYTGCDDESQLRHIKSSVETALNAAGFKLRKFKSNLPTIFETSDLDISQNLIISESSNTLGLGWDPSSDTIHFPTNFPSQTTNITKRIIMSNSFKIFDPLGLLSPFIIQAKMLLQSLWSQKIDWDEPVPQETIRHWCEFVTGLLSLSNLKIPRHVICDLPKCIEMHSFSDASQRAYGACVYIRSVNNNSDVTMKLLCAKSKVASLKPVTIPRLELCAALLAARLCRTITDTLRYIPTRIIHWCDSSVVLGWLRSDPSKLKTFVANRVGEINELTESSSWRYVPTECNPADLISRGVNASQLINFDLWWSGPSYLRKEESQWPVLNSKIEREILPETKNLKTNLQSKNLSKMSYSPNIQSSTAPEMKINMFITNCENIVNFEKFSNLCKLQRIFAYVQRFLHNLKNPNKKRTDFLTTEELNNSFTYLCSVAQQQSFPDEYKLLSNNSSLKQKSKILSLSPFFDVNVIRVGGRIGTSDYPYNKKHPILLDSAHCLTKLIFQREHLRNLHAGPQLLLASVREFVWPTNGRRLARRTVRNCVRCSRLQGKTMQPKMGDLPSQRLKVDFPFTCVGLDFAGPFSILNRKGRGAKLIKCYLCLFVCLKYKCMHLEAVSDLSKDAFIMTLRRFVSRRGKPTEIFCDNGRNFVAAAKELSQFLKHTNKDISEFAAEEGIKFKFIPAYAPHFGGIWEAGVKSAKHHLKRVMGNSHVTFEELMTLFAQVEAVLNSRPLCPLSDSPDDFLFLSPGHFLVGRPLTALPTPSLETRAESSLTRYARLQKIHHHFWSRWQKEFIAELQQRRKWKNHTDRQLEIGDLVLLQEDHVPPLSWRLGRVHRLFPGPDGITRVADINTMRGCVRRPLVRLCPLHPASLQP